MRERTGGSAQPDAPLTFRLARVRPLYKPPYPTYNPAIPLTIPRSHLNPPIPLTIPRSHLNPPIPLTIPRSHLHPPIPLTSRCPLAALETIPAPMLLAFCLAPRLGAHLLTACRLELGTAAPALPCGKAAQPVICWARQAPGRGKRQAESRCRCGRVQDSPLLGNAWELSKLGQAREPPSGSICI
jgi:hypothetical protein